MALEEENVELDSEVNSTDATSGTQTFGFSSSRGAANPYTGQLQELLTKYLSNSEKAATDKQALLDKARERVMARSAGPDKAEMAFRVAAALGKPTRTGSFGESLGNVAHTLPAGETGRSSPPGNHQKRRSLSSWRQRGSA